MFAKIKSLLAPPVFADEELTRKARNLNYALLPNIFLLALVLLTRTAASSIDGREALVVGMFIFQVSLFVAMRRGFVKITGYLFAIGIWLLLSLLLWQGGGVQDTAFMAYFIAILMASLLADRWMTLAISGLTIAVGWALVFRESAGLLPTIPATASEIMIAYSFILVAAGVLVYLLVAGLRNAVARVEKSNQELQELSLQLEKRVQERTQALAVAAEVGRRISRIQNLDKLLAESVELIRERFALYHVQVYLADSAGQNLSLKASAGTVGRQLLARGHRLPIRWGSINGMAATDKKPVLIADTDNNPLFHANSLLPFTRSELAVPLLVGERLVGVLDLQSERTEVLTNDSLPIYQSLADQLAVAVENIQLLREAERAQQEAEQYAKLVSHSEQLEDWGDAETKKIMGVRYDLNTLEEYDGPVVAEIGSQALRVPIMMANESFGTIQVEADGNREWTDESRALVTAVAQQIGQRAKNLRLLVEADRYRAEAQQAVRSLSRQAWRQYLSEQRGQVEGFVYAEDTVTTWKEDKQPHVAAEPAVQVPLKINEEAIGEFVVAGGNTAAAQMLLKSVANQLSNHLENIRLAQQTESALGQTENLYRIGREINAAKNVNDILHAALGPIFPTGIDEATLMFMELNRYGEPQTLELLATWRLDGNPSFPVGTVFPIKRFPFASLFMSDSDAPQLISDVSIDPRVDEFTRGVMAHAGIKSIAVVPLTVGGEWVGIITCSWPQPHEFSKLEEEIFSALINMAAPAVQSQRLYFQTKVQAEREQVVNQINQRILNTESMEDALQTAVKELGQTLQTAAQVKLATTRTSDQNKVLGHPSQGD